LASAADILPLEDIILSNVELKPDSFFAFYLQRWSATFGSPLSDQPLSGKQSFQDRSGILADKATVGSNLSNEREQASSFVATVPHSGDWLLALSIVACGLHLDDETVRTAVALRSGMSLCVAHPSQCGAHVDAYDVHSLVCKRASVHSTKSFIKTSN
jgi:hypothetical protein